MADSAPRPGRLPAVVFVLLTLGAVLVAVLHASVKQDLAYHLFADRRTLLGVKNALDVPRTQASRSWGRRDFSRCGGRSSWIAASAPPWAVLFTGVTLTSAGSASSAS